jgi:hypothetical protein
MAAVIPFPRSNGHNTDYALRLYSAWNQTNYIRIVRLGEQQLLFQDIITSFT